MCCRCCSVTQQKFWVFGFGVLFATVGILMIVWLPGYITDIIYESLPLSETSRTYDMWKETPIPVYNHMYLFNWTNAADVHNTEVKPNFDPVGPYVFREQLIKEEVTWYDNKTVSYKPRRTWFFEQALSAGKPEDMVTCPHIPSLAAAELMRNQPRFIKIIFNTALNNNGGALSVTHTAMEWIFDSFYDEFLDYAMKMNNPLVSAIEDNHFAWFLNRNGSKEFEGIFTIHTGQGDLTQMGDIKRWNGLTNTGYFDGECGNLNGSASDLWVPNRPLDEYITVYVKDTCRIINLVPTGEIVKIEGIEGMKYATTKETFDNGQLNGDMQCYCAKDLQPDNCPKSGATFLGTCASGVPMYLSHSHFMYADESYANTITGLSPNPDRDSFFIVLETKLGIPLQVSATVQVSLHIKEDKDITLMRNIPEFYAPLFVTSNQAVIDKDLAKQVRFALNTPGIIRIVGIVVLVVGVVLLVIGVVLTATQNWYRQKSKLLINKQTMRDNVDKSEPIANIQEPKIAE